MQKNCVLAKYILLGHNSSTNRYFGIDYGERSQMLQSSFKMPALVFPANCVFAGNPARIICSFEKLVNNRKNLSNK